MGGRPKVNSKSIELALKMYEDKTCSVSEILKVTGISKVTLYKYIRQYNLHSWEYSLRTDHNA
ncbi:MAG: helix-turn-helix domain-containing protein [Paludibacteraceae bacterium]|nr:helix-turn-helix domain-containing protein [Paludibacteraceae bacterium]MBR6041314.1 helix-turn-helix domain-containing protein [Paludibacteraceae bacterium]